MNRRTFVRSALLFTVSWTGTLHAQAPRPGPGGPGLRYEVRNTRMAPDFGGAAAQLLEGGILMAVNEAFQGMDLDGDGQLGHVVLVYFDEGLGESVTLGIAGLLGQAQRDVAWVNLNEGQAGDLNGDGDTQDYVLGVFRPGAGLDIVPLDPTTVVLASDDWVFFNAGEAANGFTDFNNDGDTSDFVFHSYRISTKELHNSRIAAAPELAGDVDRCAFLADEAAGGEDLNGNGTSNDRVLFLFDGPTKTASNLGLASSGAALSLRGRWLVFDVDERKQGQLDLNADGDSKDLVVHTHDLVTGTTTNVGYSTVNFVADPLITGTHVLFKTLEADHGDLNEDGDEFDSSFVIHDLFGNTTLLTRLATSNFVLSLTDGRLVAFGVDEDRQEVDLNGDGDALDDYVVHVFDTAQGTLTNTGYSSPSSVGLARGRLFLSPREADQGGKDLNGDGDSDDTVAHVLELRTGEVFGLGLATLSFVTGERVTALRVTEAGSGETDLNGDGDADDIVLFAIDDRSRTPSRVGPEASPLGAIGSTFLATIREFRLGKDLNGDGDLFDTVPHFFRFPSETR